ncbi:hypothetical protein [Actinomadura opuntiae]|uniref:hypothetical protein n=1 Tax=Actinomadura sp. OS1-43 TaxID=604315 RepID=UPI00255B11E0|nr:hypothetical protein [Actinomadura sp. OS1-43]MDL4821608.1 hypothetical protein [Actinomadura sp. OS1-43]
MTERSPGAPDPVGPSNRGGTREPASRPQAPAVTLLADLGAVRRTDAVIDALAARRAAGSAPRSAADRPAAERARPDDEGAADPAVRLLRALIADVDEPDLGRDAAGPPDPGPGAPPSTPGPGPRRRGPRTIVALGVAGAVLASTGVAAAGGGVTDRAAASPPAGAGVSGPAEPRAKDTDAGTHTSPRTPQPPATAAVPAPAPERPAAEPTAAEDPGHRDYDRIKRNLEHILRAPGRPHRTAPHRARAPHVSPMIRPSAPPDDDARRTIDDIRRRAEKRMNQYENPDRD